VVVVLGDGNGLGAGLSFRDKLLGCDLFDDLLVEALTGFDDEGLWFLDDHHCLVGEGERFFDGERHWFLEVEGLLGRDHVGLLVDDVGFVDIEVVVNWFLFDVSRCDDRLFLDLDNVQFRLDENYCFPRYLHFFVLFLDVGGFNFLNGDGLFLQFKNLLPLDSLDIQLYDWLLVKDGGLCQDLHRHLHLDWHLHSLLDRDDLSDLNHSVDETVDVYFHGFLLNH
jgi:hypothetical protein